MERLFRQTLLDLGFSEEALEELAEVTEFRTLKGGEAVLDYGENSDKINLVLEGAFFARHLDRETGNYRTIGFHLPQYQPFMAGIDSYFNGNSNTIRLEAARKSVVAIGHRDTANEIMARHKDLESYYHQWIIGALTLENSLRINLLTLSSARFYQFLLNDYPEIIQEIPAKYIAEFMGISDVWLSKIKKQM